MSSFITQRCPICKANIPREERYPNYICCECTDRALDKNGNQLEFLCDSLSSQLIVRNKKTGKRIATNKCYVDGVLCLVETHRFGGIVAQPIELMERELIAC
jgi:predicted RNA-binding Zn-ribbon protein involved in translation (DUF1610 family)